MCSLAEFDIIILPFLNEEPTPQCSSVDGFGFETMVAGHKMSSCKEYDSPRIVKDVKFIPPRDSG